MEGAVPSVCVVWMGGVLCSLWDMQDLLLLPVQHHRRQQGTSPGAAGIGPKSGTSLKTPSPGDSGSWDKAQSIPEQPHS